MRRALAQFLLNILNLIIFSSTSESSLIQPRQNGGLAYARQKGEGYDYTQFTQDQNERAEAVIEMFRFAWNGYYTYAYPHDDYWPKTNNFTDSYNGWGVTMIDGLDTAIIMEQQDIVKIILDWIPTVNFTKNQAPPPNSKWTNLFGTNIRFLGGMLSAYDLLKGPFSHISKNSSNVDALLTQAQSLADAMKFAFDTPSGIPVNVFYLDDQTFQPSDLTSYLQILAQFGTLCLEWQHLSDLTGDPSYGALVQKAESAWFDAAEVWPGLTGSKFNVKTGEVTDSYGGWTAGNDSAYEYLIKMYVYDPDRYENYSRRWQAAADSTIEHLLGHPSTRPDLTVAGTFDGTTVQNYSDEYACFMGGNFILASAALNRSDYLRYGLDFSEFCADGYRYTASGIGPGTYSWNTSLLSEKSFSSEKSLYEKAGWFIAEEGKYSNGQRPEAVESWYYAYQATGDQYWRDVAWTYTLAQNRTERVESGTPGAGGWLDVNNVLVANGDGTKSGLMQSFMLAETLKYQYLIQTEKKGIWDVLYGPENENYFVFNTEAHPLRVAARKPP